MSVITYLQKRASDAVLSSSETASITTSIATLQSRLNSHFGVGLSNQFKFGSQTRGPFCLAQWTSGLTLIT
jgi:Second Messenger Oligonucleotide or Dinucleotide Synthetase domain